MLSVHKCFWWWSSFSGSKGRMASPKVMNFWKSSKRPLPPPPPLIFGKSCCAFFPEYMTEEAFIMAKICNINFWIGNDPPPPPPLPPPLFFLMIRRPPRSTRSPYAPLVRASPNGATNAPALGRLERGRPSSATIALGDRRPARGRPVGGPPAPGVPTVLQPHPHNGQ